MLTKLNKLFNTILVLSLVAIVIFAVIGANYASGYLDPAIVEKIKEIPIEIKTFVDPFEESCAELTEEIAGKYPGIPKFIIDILIAKESTNRKDAVKFEAHHMSTYAAKITKDPELQRMYASSWGCMQVMGWHAPRFGMTYAQLLIPRNNVEVGVAILSDCFERHKNVKDKYERYYNAFKCYNGADVYAKDMMSRVVDKLIEINL